MHIENHYALLDFSENLINLLKLQEIFFFQKIDTMLVLEGNGNLVLYTGVVRVRQKQCFVLFVELPASFTVVSDSSMQFGRRFLLNGK